MKLKKTLAIASAVIVLASFILLLFHKIYYLVFFGVAAANAFFAYKILPKIK